MQIAVGGDCREIFIFDEGLGQVQEFDGAGVRVQRFGSPKWVSQPVKKNIIPDGGLAVDAKGRLFVGCGSDGNVKMLVEDPSLHLQGCVWGDGSMAVANGRPCPSVQLYYREGGLMRVIGNRSRELGQYCYSKSHYQKSHYLNWHSQTLIRKRFRRTRQDGEDDVFPLA